MRYNLKLAEAFHKTDIGLDGILVALGKEPPNPKTVVTYQGGTIEEYLIEEGYYEKQMVIMGSTEYNPPTVHYIDWFNKNIK